MMAASTKRLSKLQTIILTPRGVGWNLWRGPPLVGCGAIGGGGTFRWYARVQRPTFPWKKKLTVRQYLVRSHDFQHWTLCLINAQREREGLTWERRDRGTQMMALPSREHVTMLSWVNLQFKKIQISTFACDIQLSRLAEAKIDTESYRQ